MDFIKIVKKSRFLDPLQGFAETERFSEVRYDPLTGCTTRILDFPVRELERDDLGALAEISRAFCPFCPELVEQVTPKFQPGLLSRERYAQGEALCVPNAFPYDENGAVTIMSHGHYLKLREFTREILSNALTCCADYLQDVVKHQPEVVYQSINWNYMPVAGGSIIHPHLQVTASSTPTNYYTLVMEALRQYRRAHGAHFWHDLVEQERAQGERFIAEAGDMSWMVAFAPMGVFDVIGVMEEVSRPADLKGGLLDDMVGGVLNVLGYIDSLNMYSLNMSIYFLLDEPLFTPHVRICPRVSIPPFGTSQINYMRMLHNESMTTMKPEEVCTGIRRIWDGRI